MRDFGAAGGWDGDGIALVNGDAHRGERVDVDGDASVLGVYDVGDQFFDVKVGFSGGVTHVDGIDDGANDFAGCHRASLAIERTVEHEKFFGCGARDALRHAFQADVGDD